MADDDVSAEQLIERRGQYQTRQRRWRESENVLVHGHRIRQVWAYNASRLFGVEVEVDETYMSGKENNKHPRKKFNAGRGAVGKTVVVGLKEQFSKHAQSVKADDTKAHTLLQMRWTGC